MKAYHEKANDYDSSFQAYLDEQEIIYYPIDISSDTSKLNQSTVSYIAGLLGKPRNYGKITFYSNYFLSSFFSYTNFHGYI